MRDLWPGDAAGGGVRGANQQIDLFGLHDRRGGEVPEIFADEDSHPAEPRRVEGLETFAGGEVSLLVKKAVGGQIDLAVEVDDPPALGVKDRVVEAMLRRLLDEAGDQGRLARRRQQPLDLRGVGADGQVGHHVADEVAGQRKLGEDDQIGLLPQGRFDPLEVHVQVAVQIAQRRRNLRHRNAEQRRFLVCRGFHGRHVPVRTGNNSFFSVRGGPAGGELGPLSWGRLDRLN